MNSFEFVYNKICLWCLLIHLIVIKLFLYSEKIQMNNYSLYVGGRDSLRYRRKDV